MRCINGSDSLRKLAVADYNEVFYNRKRMHSTLGYRTPAQALHDYRSAAAAAWSNEQINPRDCPESLTQPKSRSPGGSFWVLGRTAQ